MKTRCGIDTVQLERIDRLLRETPSSDLYKLYTPRELSDAGNGPGRVESLAARFAAKEACAKLFPRELALGAIEPTDFSVARDNYGAPKMVFNARALAVLDRHRIGSIEVSLTHDHATASAVVLAEPAKPHIPLIGKILYHAFPFRRAVILENLRRAFPETVTDEHLQLLAQAHYAHLAKLFMEFVQFRWISRERLASRVRVENIQAFVAARAQGKGILVLTGHFGNWEVATIAGIANYPEVRGRFQFVRRALKPKWLDALVTRRFNQAGFGVLGKRGSLDAILDRLSAGDAIVFPFDQHASPPDGIAVEFFGEPAWTFKSLAILALATGAPVLPATSWREPDGSHVLRFEEPLAPIECDNTNEAIRRNTRAYNALLERLVLRHPEQWYWVHRRWKRAAPKRALATAKE